MTSYEKLNIINFYVDNAIFKSKEIDVMMFSNTHEILIKCGIAYILYRDS